ncbi:hypothetical protein POM88_010122 [Heracleum sosnowskyi]|uniref:Uncharacterized protein n=1 Tax=Heracleum sosnowskyi TaxID=360622 RepID=A0AAD8JB79_9APIA|nr:hypothetical protein POM88_010122 [Heracleum sosnowskyi]
MHDSQDLEQTMHDSPDKTNIGSLEQTIDDTLKNEEPKEFQEAAQQVNSCVDLNDYSKASLFPIIGRYHHCVIPESDDHCREILQYQRNAGSEVEEPYCVLTDSEGNFHCIRDSDSDGIFECFLLDIYDKSLGTMRFKCPADYNVHKPSGEPIRNCLSEEETTQFQPNAISTADKTYAEPIKKTACLDSPLRQFWLNMARNVWKRAKEVLRILREQLKWPRGPPEKIKSLCAECSRPIDGSSTPQPVDEKQLFYDTYGGRNSRNLYYPPSSSTLANFSNSQLFRDAARRPNFNLYYPPSSS